MTRPWRLTRRQRVEMEAALATMRLSAWSRYLDPRDLHRAMMRLGCALEAAPGIDAGTPFDGVRRIEGAWWRTLRARVALALRAALRADEDARCEEVLAQAGGYVVEWDECVSLMREWPEVARGPHPTATVRAADLYGWPQDHPCADMCVPALAVPLALWERSPHPVTDKPR